MTETTKTIEALGLKFTFGENSELADLDRENLRIRANFYVFNEIKKLSERDAAFGLLTYYPDVLSSLESVEGDSEIHNSLISSPAEWVKFCLRANKEKKFDEVYRLVEAARALNPHWNPEEPLEGASEAVRQAEAVLEDAKEVIDLDNPSSKDHPETTQLIEASEKVVDFVEAKAKEAGKVGPKSFPASRTGQKER